jgi:hypothetical protein
MAAAVPGGQSLARDYERDHGTPHPVDEPELAAYDLWFGIKRPRELGAAEFLESAKRAVTDTCGCIISDSGLDRETTDELAAGIEVAAETLEEWIGRAAPPAEPVS